MLVKCSLLHENEEIAQTEYYKSEIEALQSLENRVRLQSIAAGETGVAVPRQDRDTIPSPPGGHDAAGGCDPGNESGKEVPGLAIEIPDRLISLQETGGQPEKEQLGKQMYSQQRSG